MTSGFGSIYEISRVGFKPFSCCRLIQSSVQACRDVFTMARVDAAAGEHSSWLSRHLQSFVNRHSALRDRKTCGRRSSARPMPLRWQSLASNLVRIGSRTTGCVTISLGVFKTSSNLCLIRRTTYLASRMQQVLACTFTMDEYSKSMSRLLRGRLPTLFRSRLSKQSSGGSRARQLEIAPLLKYWIICRT